MGVCGGRGDVVVGIAQFGVLSSFAEWLGVGWLQRRTDIAQRESGEELAPRWNSTLRIDGACLRLFPVFLASPGRGRPVVAGGAWC
jgi:hypothetical protein